MPKNKKTRQQKILADKRRDMQNASFYSLTTNSLKEQVKQPTYSIKQTDTITISSYEYFVNDLRKTAILTGFIVLGELILRYFTKV